MTDMAITHLQLMSMPVSDQDRAKAFYVDVLGFELVSDTQMSPDMRWVMVRPRGGQSAITLVTWFDSMPAGSLNGTVLESDDLARLAAQAGRDADAPVAAETVATTGTGARRDGSGGAAPGAGWAANVGAGISTSTVAVSPDFQPPVMRYLSKGL